MDTGIYQGVAAMRSSEKRMDTIAANLANIGARGFKRQSSVTRSFNVGMGDRKHVEFATQRATDFSQGELAHTGNQLDLALEGPGFFAIDMPNGRAYTRDGSFRLDNNGTLLTQDGDLVAWEGSNGKLQPTGEAIRIEDSGTVYQGEQPIGRLKIVEFDNPNLLEEDAHGNWRAPRGMREQNGTARVHQNYVERSNVSPMDELVGMVLVQRRFENSGTVMRSIDQTYKRLNQPHN